MEETIKRIAWLNDTIRNLKAFLELLEHSDRNSIYTDSKKVARRDEFDQMWVKSHLWTGTDNPPYDRKITDKTTMNELSKVMKPVLALRISVYEAELASLIKQ